MITVRDSCKANVKLAYKRLEQVSRCSQDNVSEFEQTTSDFRLAVRSQTVVFTCIDCDAPDEPQLLVGGWNMLNSALWIREARMNNTTGYCSSAAPSTKGWSKMLCYITTSSWGKPELTLYLTKDSCNAFCTAFPQIALKNKLAQPLLGSLKWICKHLQKLHTAVHQHKAKR